MFKHSNIICNDSLKHLVAKVNLEQKTGELIDELVQRLPQEIINSIILTLKACIMAKMYI